MNNVKSCGRAVLLDGVAIGKVSDAGEEKIAILGLSDEAVLPALLFSCPDAWRIVQEILELLAKSGNGVAEDARRMLCHGQGPAKS